MKIKTQTITLEDAFMLSKRVKHFIFKCERPFDFIPGKFITMHFEHEGKAYRRSYSLANTKSGTATIEFAAGFVEGGLASTRLFALKKGDTIDINGPFGRLTLKDPLPKRIILVATSTGVTPYRAMLSTLSEHLKSGAIDSVVIMQGVQYQNEWLYKEEFETFAKAHKNVTLYACYSREKETSGFKEYEHTGYVQHFFESLNLSPTDDRVYLCGNPNMIDNAYELLKNCHFETPSIVREKYISS